ncbi:tyrosine-type recombinase/integrase [Acinetobacter seifertii]|uniref:tyrosine-type recombinase/integrase n=1 Tax=Acinetobacter seifertii TaxID=1530123 RepID=UPI003EDF51AA
MRPKTHTYNSKAHIEYIENFTHTYAEPSGREHSDQSFYCVRMPVIIQSDNTVWELGSVYIQSLLIEKSLTQSSIESTANALLDYLRFIEHNDLDILHLPASEPERVTYRYRAFLLSQIRQSKKRPSTNNQKINKVIQFYKFFIKNKLFHKDSLRNLPYEEVDRRITFTTEVGLTKEKIVQSTNISITVPRKHHSANTIKDGGVLHPLTDHEQNIVKQYLRDNASREFQLMCYLALHTGARLQTVCTLRVHNIKSLKDKKPDPFDNTYALEVGGNTTIDTKFGISNIIKIPTRLVDELIKYSESKAWKDRAKLSYYGNSTNNYIFLTARGSSYYTSIQEIEDRRISQSLKGFKPKRGLSVSIHVNQMLKKINKEDIKVSPFSFHDLRATFGLNTLKILIRCGFKHDTALMYLKERMGHRYISTTMRYLEYAEFSENVISANTNLSEALNQFSDR